MVKIIDESQNQTYYGLTPADIDAGFEADDAWSATILDLTKVNNRPVINASRAGELAVEALLADIFPVELAKSKE